MKKLTLFILLGLCLALDAFSQAKSPKAGNAGDANIFGTVQSQLQDSRVGLRNAPMVGAVVQLFFQNGNQLDSLYTIANQEGKFSFRKLRAQRVRIKVTMMGYSEHDNYYDLESGSNVIMIMLENEDILLKEAAVSADMKLMRTVKDTTIYNAAAVYTHADESARAILEQLPGFRIRGGNILVDGHRVTKAYVNGTLVFGDSPMTAVSSLKADEVKEIKVYDELSAVDRHRGMMNGRKEKVMDIVTKEPILSMTQASVTGAVGIDGTESFRGHAAAAIMFNSEMASGTAAFKTGNIDRSDLNQEHADANQLASVRIDGSPYTENQMQHALVLKGEKHFGSRDYGNSIKGYYMFDQLKANSASRALTDYFETASSPEMTYADTTSSLSTNRRHVFNLSANLMDTPLKSFLITSNTEIVDNSLTNTEIQRIRTSGISDDIYSNTLRDDFDHDVHSSMRVFWSNNDSRKYRPTVTLDVKYGNVKGNGWTLDTLASSHTRRQLQSEKIGESYYARLESHIYRTLMNTKERTISLSAAIGGEYDRHADRQMSYDFLDVEDPVLNPGGSYDYNWNKFSLVAYASLMYDTKKAHISAGLDLADEINLDRESYPMEYRYARNYFNVLPQFIVEYKFSQYQSLGVNISAMPFSPSLEQTRDRISDANPLSLTGGNRDLRQSYTLDWHNNYSLRLKERNAFYLMLKCDLSMTFGQIVTKTTYFSSDTVLPEWDDYVAKAGAMLHTFQNASRPSCRINLAANATDMFVHRKLKVDLNPSWTWAHTNQYVRNEMIGMNSSALELSSGIVWKDKNNKLSLSPRIGWNRSENDRGDLNTEAISYSMNLSCNRSMVKGRVFAGGGYSLSGYNYLSSIGRDNMYQNLYLMVGGFMFRNTVQIVLMGGDLLDASSNYSIVENALSFSQKWSPSYGRYVILSVGYRFRQKK